jgi:alpha-N-arabinofuranosidase
MQIPTLTFDLGKAGISVSPSLYGLMTEEINYSYDGGLYGELVRNRTFKDDAEKAIHWSAVGSGSSISLDKKGGMNSTLPVAIHVKGAVANDGYWGMPVRPNTSYELNLWARSDKPGPIAVSLESPDGKTIFAQAEVSGVGATYKKLTTSLKTGSVGPTSQARLVLRTGADRTTSINLVSLFPPTYKSRPNGNRPDLMQMLVDMKPTFLRFPGGNYLEGNTFKDRFDWKKTLGPIETRPGHMAPWSYRSSDGMGMLEFLYWCEDMNAKPVLGLFAGYVLRGDYIEAGTELQGFVQDALDQIEYVIGGPNTKWGARRVKDGHPKPFPLEAVEVGNEDGFDLSGSYEDRFVQFYDAIKKKYPKLKVISSTGGKDWLGARFPITKRKPDMVDEHYYASTWDLMAMAHKYDDYDRNGPKIFVGEWAAQDVPEPWSNPGQKGPTPNMSCAISDAAFMTGMERNTDIVLMSCYAPLLVNVNPGARQWAVNLIGYDALNCFGSPSYYAQKMFAEHLGDRTVPISMANAPTQTQGTQTIPGLFASATRDARAIYIKVVNPLARSQEISINLKGGSVTGEGKVVVLSGDPKAVNTLAEPTKIAPVTRPLTGLGGVLTQELPAHSISVFQIAIQK